MSAGPRVLVTGFEPFPGAPFNPTKWLVGRLRETPPAIADMGAFRAEVLPVSYAAVGPRLSEIGRAFPPDIAIHFGLARDCGGFRLERIARNRLVPLHADNAGHRPDAGPICAGPESFASSLPLDAIQQALSADGIPAEWSDDAGGYLCNAVFTLSLARAAPGFSPRMSGFVHVPLVSPMADPADNAPCAFDAAALLRGAELVVRCCVAAFVSRRWR